ncbi:MAG: rRNA maturation RNase YbeY, partial [Terriglobales bacterium]
VNTWALSKQANALPAVILAFMPVSVTIANRQRRVSLDSLWLERTVHQLAHCVLTNLSQRPLKRLPPADLEQMQLCGEISLVLVSDKKIRELNRHWRGKDYATDVLSFPLAVDEHGVEPRASQEELWELGEIVISLEKTVEQALELGHSFERELAFLFVHGTLHILGFDHITKAQEKEMFARQREILARAGLPRL